MRRREPQALNEMMSPPRPVRSAAFAASAVLLVATAIGGGDQALAQGKLDASYTITFARIPVGNIATVLELGAGDYMISSTGHAGGVIRSLVSGEAAFAARGAVKDGRAVPAGFTSRIAAADENVDVTMVINDGTVEKLTVVPPPGSDRVPVTDADRRGIVDPLSAFLIPRAAATTAGAAGADPSADACQRTLPIFDGLQRYDLKLAYKRMDKVAAEKGYAGPVVVCSIAYQPIAGHRASTPLIKYISEGREIEIAFAPIAGTRMLLPFQVSVMSMLANLVIKADRFEASGAGQ
jgi:hypothetical protein